VTGLPPYYSRDTSEIYESILNEELSFPDKISVSNELKHLLRGLLCKSPSERLGVEGGIAAIMVHPWFKNINFIALL
jgi:serum/glucocorticoid-regulated kinase 2